MELDSGSPDIVLPQTPGCLVISITYRKPSVVDDTDVFVTEWPLMAGRPSHFNILHCNPGVADIIAWLKTQDAYSTLANKKYYPFPHC